MRDGGILHVVKVEAPQWFGYAKQKVADLWRESQRLGGIYLRRKYLVEGGNVRVYVWCHLQHKYIRIEGGSCPSLLSGLAEARELTAVTVDGVTSNVFTRFQPAPGNVTWETVKKFVGNFPSFQTLSRTPGRYSGKMRLVVQDNLGRGLDIPYSYTWATTHGIWTGSTLANGRQGKLWVIEVSNSGILAWPLSTCTAKSGAKTAGLDVIPLPTSKPLDENGNPDMTRITTLAAASEVADFYAGNPIYAYSGWAFSVNGSKAVNITLTTNSGFQWAKLYRIDITSSPDGQSPASATMTLVEENYFYGNRLTHMKVPVIDGVVSLDWYQDIVVGPGVDYETPVHAWYEGETLKVVRYHHMEEDVTSVNTSAPPSSGTVAAVLGEWGTYDVTTQMESFSSPVLDAYTITLIVGDHNSREIYDGPYLLASSSFPPQTFLRILERAYTDRDYSQINTDVLIIPPFDREAVFHYRRIEATDAYGAKTSEGTLADYGPYWLGYSGGITGCNGEAEMLDRSCALTSTYDEIAELDAWPSIWQSGYIIVLGEDQSLCTDQGGSAPPGYVYCLCESSCGGGTPPESDDHIVDAALDGSSTNSTDITNSYECSVYADGAAYDCVVDEDNYTVWEAYSTENQQDIHVHPDATSARPPIYTRIPATAALVSRYGEALSGGAPYEIGSVSTVFLSFTGNP